MQVAKTNTLLDYSRSLNVANNKIEKLQNELYSQVTGGNTKPFIHPMGYEPNVISFVLRNKGKHSIPNVTISYIDMYDLKIDNGHTDLTKIDIRKYFRSQNIGTLYPNSVVTNFYRKEIPASWNDIYFTIYLYWPNGGYQWSVNYKRNELGEFRVLSSHYTDIDTGKEINFK